jgi:uncharacterized protein YoxC
MEINNEIEQLRKQIEMLQEENRLLRQMLLIQQMKQSCIDMKIQKINPIFENVQDTLDVKMIAEYGQTWHKIQDCLEKLPDAVKDKIGFGDK